MTSNLPEPDIERSIWIARPVGEIWSYLYDVSNEPQWRFGEITAEWVSDPPYGVGSTGLSVVQGMGDTPWTVTEWEELRRISWIITGSRLEGCRAGYRLEPEESGTRMTIHFRAKRSVFMRIMMLFMKGTINRQLTGDIEKLKAILEAEETG